jgi:NAD dependent epimerase/dehydratase family enzyme
VIHFIINNYYLSGPVNAVASHNTFSEFANSLAKSLNQPCFFKTPAMLAKLLFGQMGEELILSGQKVCSFKLNECGFNFSYYNLDLAFQNIFSQ